MAKMIDERQPKCLLLALPGELRNRIYDYCLIEEDIWVTRDTKPPGLLSACRRIREETRPIWFGDNTFKFDIQNCDASVMRLFQKQVMVSLRIPSLRLAFRQKVRFYVSNDTGSINWDNLEKWCMDTHQGELDGIAIREDGFEDVDAVVQAALNMARNGRNVAWEDFKIQLKPLRLLAGRLNPNWLK